jgi:hypothetical protein
MRAHVRISGILPSNAMAVAAVKTIYNHIILQEYQ